MEKLIYIFVLLVGHPSNGDIVIVTDVFPDAIACQLRVDEELAKQHAKTIAYCAPSGHGVHFRRNQAGS